MKKKNKKPEEALLEEKEALTPEEESVEETEEALDSSKKMEEDIALFRELFPQVKASEIPDSVWKRVEEGESLAASFALHLVQEEKKKEHIQQVNADNEKKAAPKIRRDGAENDYFSPEAVKAMSRQEIKKNYDAILRSMEKWT